MASTRRQRVTSDCFALCDGMKVAPLPLRSYLPGIPKVLNFGANVGTRNSRFPEEFRAPKAYESLGGTNPRWAGLCLWGFGILADAGSGAAIAAACPTTCFVPDSVRCAPVLRAAMIADSERWGVAEGIGHDSG